MTETRTSRRAGRRRGVVGRRGGGGGRQRGLRRRGRRRWRRRRRFGHASSGPRRGRELTPPAASARGRHTAAPRRTRTRATVLPPGGRRAEAQPSQLPLPTHRRRRRAGLRHDDLLRRAVGGGDQLHAHPFGHKSRASPIPPPRPSARQSSQGLGRTLRSCARRRRSPDRSTGAGGFADRRPRARRVRLAARGWPGRAGSAAGPPRHPRHQKARLSAREARSDSAGCGGCCCRRQRASAYTPRGRVARATRTGRCLARPPARKPLRSRADSAGAAGECQHR